MKKILITGANGYLAHQLIKEFELFSYSITVMSSNPYTIAKEYSDKDIEIISNEEILSGNRVIKDIDIVIHTAFCRKSIGSKLYESLVFMQNLVKRCLENKIRGFINISSQAVYPQVKDKFPDEKSTIDPGYLYAFAKVSSELLLDQMVSNDSIMKCTNIRLASLIGPGNIIPNNVLAKFIFAALKGEQFHVIGGKQNFSFLDIRDAAKAISLLAQKDPNEWEKHYNLGSENQTNILEMANVVCQKVKELYGIDASYKLIPDEISLNAGMDSRRIYSYLNWHPEYLFSQTVEDTIIAMKKETFGV